MTDKRHTILVVDDEPDLCDILRFNLEDAGYSVHTAYSASEALAFGVENADLILLDVMMPGMDGFTLARRLKAAPATAPIPIIFLTARDTEEDTVSGLELGADDYIAKPFSIREVLARVAAVLRRVPETDHGAGVPLALDTTAKTLIIDGQPVPLTRTEYELLDLFLQSPGKIFSRASLLAAVWPEDVIVTERTVDVNITRIRKKLGPYADRLRTRSGFGYYYDATA
ncbi:MAG: response regulator transcription factor [Bacteroidales bacterium]|nr:response regulator transcription factor [Bacteroidales bacterium]